MDANDGRRADDGARPAPDDGPMLRDHLRTALDRHLAALTALPRTLLHPLDLRRLAALPVEVVAFALAAGMWAVFLARGVCYPLFGADHLERSWGGPTLAGAWFVHFIQGPPLLYLVSLVLRPLLWADRQLSSASNDIQVEVGGP
jgi:hypothetical protein